MLKFSIITLFPKMFLSLTEEGVISRAIKNNLLKIDTVNLRDYALDSRKTVDERPAGGGDGMVIRPDITKAALAAYATEESFIIHLSPSGQPFNHEIAKEFSQKKHIVLLSGRYAGFDSRVVNKYAHMHLSIGNFVLSGGELPAMCVIDATARFIPGVLGNTESASSDSFEDGLLEAPVYTKPLDFEGESIPEILISGNHAKIKHYKRQEQLKITAETRPDLIKKMWHTLTEDEKTYVKTTHPQL